VAVETDCRFCIGVAFAALARLERLNTTRAEDADAFANAWVQVGIVPVKIGR
jgi:hypothetical protein